MKKQQFYFKHDSSEYCYRLEHLLSKAKENGLKEIELIEAMPDKIRGVFWCKSICECVDVHHADGRGKGKDVIENPVGLCHECHLMSGKDKSFNNHVKDVHLKHVARGYVVLG